MKNKILSTLLVIIGLAMVYYNFENIYMNPLDTAEASTQANWLAFMIADMAGLVWFLPTGLDFILLSLLLNQKEKISIRNLFARKIVFFVFIAVAVLILIMGLFFSFFVLNRVYGFIFQIPTFILALIVFFIGKKITHS